MTIAEQIAEHRRQIIAELEALIDLLTGPPVIVPPPVDSPVDPPTLPPPGPLPELVETDHDRVPVPGNLNVHVVRSGGNTSDPRTWSTGKIPGPKDRVRIQYGASVTLDGDLECETLVVEGILTVADDRSTSLTLQTLFGLPTGTFRCATPERFTCTFRPPTPDPADPLRYHGGLIWMGEFTVHGKPKSAYAELAEDVM